VCPAAVVVPIPIRFSPNPCRESLLAKRGKELGFVFMKPAEYLTEKEMIGLGWTAGRKLRKA